MYDYYKKSLITLSILLMIGLSASFSVAAPLVGSLSSNNIQHNMQLTISGSGFGTKVPAAPYFYDNFESGSNNSSIVGQTGTIGSSVWLEYMSYGEPTYSNTDHYGQGSLSAYVNVSGDSFKNAGINGLNSTKAYLSYRFKWKASGTNWQSAIYKLSRITSQDGLYSTIPSIYPQYQPNYDWAYDGYNNGGGGSGSYSFSMPSQNTWNRAEIYMELSNPAGSANGKLETRYNLVQNMNEVNVVTRTMSVSDRFLDSFILHFAVANNGAQTWTMHADNVYFDITQARVELGNNQDFNSCFHREIQIPTVWKADGTSITITANQGSFNEGDTAYLFVIDADGNVNTSGYSIVIGGSKSGDTFPSVNISSPTSATTYATSQDTIAINGTASDDVGISAITWSNDRGGSGTANNDSGDWTSWSIENIALQEGDNVITVTATDSADQTSSDTITVTSSDIVQVWSATAQTGDSAFKESVVTYCVRLLIEGDHVTQSGSAVRLGFQGRSSGDYTIRKVSVAERDTGGAEGDVIDSTWTRVTFDGNSEATWVSDVMTVAAGAEKLSDPISFSLQAGKDYYITFKIDTPSLYLNPPAFYRELYFSSADHTEDIDWSDNGHSITQDYHALSKIYVISGETPSVPSAPSGLGVSVSE